MSDYPVFVLRNICHSFHQAGQEIPVLAGIDLQLYPGELVALVGPSGCGKSTLLQICGLLETAQKGHIALKGKDCQKLSDRQRSALRGSEIGFVYQAHHLLPEFSALENVVLPQLIFGRPQNQARADAQELLERVGMGKRLSHRPTQLSGGEQQRVALARALANRPSLLFADEPTGNLDPHNAEQVFMLLRELVTKEKLACLVATHNLDLAQKMDRMVTISEGKLCQFVPA